MSKRIKILILSILGVGVIGFGASQSLPSAIDVSVENLQIKYDEATQIKAEYSLTEATFTKTDIKNPILDKYENEPKDEVKVEIGESKIISTPILFGLLGAKEEQIIEPSIKLTRWDEVNFLIRPDLSDVADKDKKLIMDGNKIRFETPKINYEFYSYPEGEGGYKMVWYLNEKPASNKIEFNIETSGLNFYFQPSMTEEHLEEGQTADETHIYDKDGNIIAERPIEVVNSYAVYHSTKGGMNDTYGKDYKTGQAFFMYRPHLTDIVGNEAWGIYHLDIKNGTYAVEIPQDFLDKAVYPIRSNDNFGYETAGASSQAVTANYLYGSVFTAPANVGAVSLIAFYASGNSNTVKCTIVLHSNLNIISNGVGGASAAVSGAAWRTSTFATPPTPSASTGYVLMGITGSSEWYFKYNAGDANQGHHDTSNNYTTPTNPTDATHNTNKYSIYATYTAAEGEATSVSSGQIFNSSGIIFKSGVIFK